MALDGILLHKIMPGISDVLPARIQKIYQISKTEVLFQLHGKGVKSQLLISCHSVYNRILITKRSYPTPFEPGNFVMVLRKYLEGSIIESVEQAELDRWCTFTIRRRNDLGDPETVHLVVELMGKYANIILVSASDKIIDALKRIPPYENNRRTIHPGASFVPTPSQNKKNPFQTPIIDPNQTLTAQFAGFSPFLAQEVEYRLNNGQSFSSIMDEIQQSDSLYIASGKQDDVFHCIPLTHLSTKNQLPLFEGFDMLYYHKEEKDRIKEISGDIYQIVKRELKHQKTKLPRLQKELDSAMDCDKWREYGDLLFAYGINETKGSQTITLKSFETEEDVVIPLDPKLNGKQNAQKAYTKYNKLKKGQLYLEEQIQICQNEITYFEGLLEQLDQADFQTAEEIKEELIKEGYIAHDRKTNKKKKKQTGPNIHTIVSKDDTSISYGRNNLQNDALTFHIARKNEIWLHAKDYHGAHVIIHSNNPSEDTLRLAANIAAYYSAGRNSSSVPVNWCPVSQIKKIPGAKPGMVRIGSYKTIYIDPDVNELREVGINAD